ncbi:RNA ligase [Mycobacterium phage Gabriel]|nr:RNA ligase [Mycobacterium phage Gabriel]
MPDVMPGAGNPASFRENGRVVRAKTRHLEECVAAGIPVVGDKIQRHTYMRDPHSGADNCICGRQDGHLLHMGTPIIRSADAEQAKQTGGMVALCPSTESAQKIVVPGGEPIDDLHLTVTYFGQDVTGQDPTELVDFLYYLTPQFPPVEANIFGTAVFNSTGDDPCIVYLVGNSPHLTPLFQQLKRFALEHYPGAAEQHDPWIPHITAAYGAGAMIDYEGPVVFDRIGLRWPGADQDFNL